MARLWRGSPLPALRWGEDSPQNCPPGRGPTSPGNGRPAPPSTCLALHTLHRGLQEPPTPWASPAAGGQPSPRGPSAQAVPLASVHHPAPSREERPVRAQSGRAAPRPSPSTPPGREPGLQLNIRASGRVTSVMRTSWRRPRGGAQPGLKLRGCPSHGEDQGETPNEGHRVLAEREACSENTEEPTLPQRPP